MTNTVDHLDSDAFSARARRIGQPRLVDPRESGRLISFLAGFPDPGSLPAEDVVEATRVALARDGEWALQYGSPLGHPDLIRELIVKLRRDQGIEAEPENILITNGAGQGLALIVEALCDPGDVVLSEEPTWSGAIQAFRSAGVEVVPISVDGQGTDVAALAAALDRLAREGRRPKLFYTIPNFQNPTGVTTTLERRRRVVALAEQHRLPVVEDDAYSDLRYLGQRLPTLSSLGRQGLVLYLGTFSKILAAGVRLGWVVAQPTLINLLAALKSEGGTSPFAGAVAARFCASGTLVEHIKELTAIYRNRRDAMLAALEATMPPGVGWTQPEGGFFVWVTLPPGVSATTLNTQARERGVEFLPGTACHFGGGDDRLRLSYSFADERQIDQGVRVIAGLIREAAAAGA